jgi:hypothetical protein
VLWGDPLLLAGAHPVAQRAVVWGAAEPTILPAPGIVLDVDDLVGRLAQRLERPSGATGNAAWIVDTQPGVFDTGPPMRAFGNRQTWLAQVELRPQSRDDLCIMESVAQGWAFLLPLGGGLASLQFVSVPAAAPVPSPSEVVSSTRTIREAVGGAGAWSEPIPCMPRARLPSARDGWLAVGEGALAFDPISGDGVGHALRGVVLAATTLHEIATGKAMAECLDGYTNTLRRAMLQHLQTCHGLYVDAPFAAVWADEIAAMQAGAALLETAAAI